MPRELWKGAIRFGLVHIPVSLYPAEDNQELSFTMLDKRDLQPVGYKRYNKGTGDEVPYDQIVKGYEYEDGRYVTLEKEDFKRLIEDMSMKWNPGEFHDTYRDDLLKMIEEKAKGHLKAVPKAKRPREAEVIDFAKLLERSLEAHR